LKGYDYSCNGAYFITLCVKDRAELLGNIELAPPPDTYVPCTGGDVPDVPPSDETGVVAYPLVGDGVLDVPLFLLDTPPSDPDGTLFDPDAPHCTLTPYGDVVAKRIADMCRHYENIEIPHYVIMPNHVHMIILVSDNEGNETTNGSRKISSGGSGMSRRKNGMSSERNVTSRTPAPTNAVLPAHVSTL
jgi:hypothetical protein